MKQCVDIVAVALSLMREAMTLLDEPGAESIAHHLRLAIDTAERLGASMQPSGPDEECPEENGVEL